MGMLMSRHREVRAAGTTTSAATRPRRNRNRKSQAQREAEARAAAEAAAAEAELSATSVYADLEDDALAEAYATNVGGDATERADQVAELEALDAEDAPGDE